MYLYLITNMINNKKYIGITNNPKKRWENHKCNNDKTMAIAKAINKYGKENFKFEVLLSGIPIEKIDEYNRLSSLEEKTEKTHRLMNEKYLEILYNIPMGFELTAGMTTNYQQLKTIYQQVLYPLAKNC